MKAEQLNDALSYIDFDLVDEFVKEKEAARRRRIKRRTAAVMTPVAACLVVLLSVGSALLGYKAGYDKSEAPQSPEQFQVFFEKEGKFVFEYQGCIYQAYVAPVMDGSILAEDEAVSIKDVGEMISTVDVIDKNGNIATMEIYASNGETSQGEILLKLDNGYFVAEGVD